MEGYEKFRRNLKILYVDVESYSKISLLKVLNKNFDNLIIAEDGIDALVKYSESKKDENKSFDLIISAIDIPKLSGIAMLEKIREKDDDIPVIILSSHNETHTVIKAIKLKIINYIIRPQNILKIYETINNSCEKIYIDCK